MSQAVTVLGGGITGLSTAWFLAQRLPPTARIQLVEGSSRLGGWVRTDRREVDGTSFIAEKGPRTLRTGRSREALAALELVDDLDLRSDVVVAQKTSAAARNRYILYNGELNCMPTGIGSLITGLPPAVRCLPRGVWHDLTTKSNSLAGVTDESINSFVSRRFGQDVDDNLASAVMHGIYAADTKVLSARALLYPFWLADHTGKTGVLRGLRRVAKLSRARNTKHALRDAEERYSISKRRMRNREFWSMIDDASMYSFRDGMQTLTDRLAHRLADYPNVDIITGQPASQARIGADGDAEIVLANGGVVRAQHVINTLPLYKIRSLFKNRPSNSLLDETPYASVAVVNVTYPKKNIVPVDGFGYLVPRASAMSSKALGVVFDSCSLPQQDYDAEISRLSVMLGGSRFDELFGSPATVTKDVLENAAMETISNHLGIKVAPSDVDATVGQNCIPSYTVGYIDRLKSMHEWVQAQLGGRMSVVGAAYGGPAVPQCIMHARDLVNHHLRLDALEKPQLVSGLEEIISGFE
ncbi:oxygen-dependent protoporphyrinogen oxidase [Coemansia erecta]|uniref:Protoporphyrinogen oxidase n=1 Tax=Coemansia erecta TaxID=147472 RepID=A0A9W8CV34_9FUNG|nr:oxygen-dependent protoporphyrinogen oxidase [Coemansia erecta]